MGKRAKIEQIYRDHYAFVWRILRRLGAPAVDDAVQEVFVVMHSRWQEFDLSNGARPLLYGIARKVAAQQRRKHERQPPALALVRDAMVDPEENSARAEAARVIEATLERMDERKRMAFVLVDIEGMSVPEVARCQRINLNTAYARLRAARQSIQQSVRRHRAREESDHVRARAPR
ncbi:MAG: sigma-70 family RNA polymerase sigma factor [Myxococcota bacterium]